MKTIFYFVFGLMGWLLATNYQVVYSKVQNYITPEQAEISADIANDIELDIDNTEEIVTDTNEEGYGNKETTALVDTANDSSNEIEIDELADDTEVLAPSNSDENIAISTESNSLNNTSVNESTQQLTEKSIVVADTNTSDFTEDNQQFAHPSFTYPMMNPNMAMMHPGMNMNPMVMMMGMMNPAMVMNHPINVMTQQQNMNAMMMAMDPKMMFGMFGSPSKEYLEGEVPEQLPVVTIPGMPTQTYQNWSKNTVSPNISREAKHNAFQTAMAMSPLSMRSMVSMMADKLPVDEGVSWDDAVEAMKLRANEVNFKFVGSSPLWKQIEAETEKPSAKVEMFRFCDARMARKILDEVPEFIIFLPCKIALLEDGEGKLWVMTLDWDVSWMDYAQNPNNHLSKDIREHAKLIRENIHYIMEGAATGDF